jgi:large subunit ribosomal protein L18
VYRSHKHIYAQLIDDKTGHTLAFSSTVDKDVSKQLNRLQQEASFSVGFSEKSVGKQIQTVVLIVETVHIMEEFKSS